MKNFFTAILLLIIVQLNAQDYDFGDVSKHELEEKIHPLDSSVNAAILYKNENISFSYSQNSGFTQERDVQVRIKIYNKDGFKWANEKIYLYKGDGGVNENVKGLKGYTFNLENGKIEKDRLKNNGIFEEKVSDFYTAESFTLPNVKEGSVIEYKYTVTSPLLVIDDVMLQYSIPVKKLDVKVAIPQYYRYNKLLNPKAFFTPNYTETKTHKQLVINNRVRGITSGPIGGVTNSSVQTDNVDYVDNVIEFNETNIPALLVESYAGNINNYRAKFSLELEARLSLNGVVEKSYATSWDWVSKDIFDNDDFGGQLGRFRVYKEDLENALNGVETDLQKIFVVENLVKSKVKWNQNFGKYAQNGVRRAYIEGEGNVADINLMIVSMLRSLGLNANPVLISTRNNGVPLFPTREGFNYVIAMVESDGKYMLVDATEPFSTNNVLPQRALNWKGRVFANDGSSNWVDIKPNQKSSKSTMLNVKINEDLSASGQVRKSYDSYAALNYRLKHTNLSMVDHVKLIESGKGAIEVGELNFENDTNITEPVKIDYKYEFTDGIDEIGGKLYFSPLLFLKDNENPFKRDQRDYPIDFIIPFADKYLVNIMIPDGYQTESLPQSEAVEFKNGDAKFVYILEENGKYLQLRIELQINNPIVQPMDYKDFKDFFAKTIEKQSEQIVLKKV